MSAKQIVTKYVVRKKMKYNGKVLNVGDEFVPAGGKWDDKIIDPEIGLVNIESTIKNKPAPRRRRKTTK